MSKLSDVLPIFVDDSVEEWRLHPRYQDLWVSNQGKFRRGVTLEDSKPLKVYDYKGNRGKSRSYSVLYGMFPDGGPQYLPAVKLVAETFLPNHLGYSYDHVTIRDPKVSPPYRASNLVFGSTMSAKSKRKNNSSDKQYTPYTFSSLINSSYKLIVANKIQKGEITPLEANKYIKRRLVEDGIKLYEDDKAALAASSKRNKKKKEESE